VVEIREEVGNLEELHLDHRGIHQIQEHQEDHLVLQSLEEQSLEGNLEEQLLPRQELDQSIQLVILYQLV